RDRKGCSGQRFLSLRIIFAVRRQLFCDCVCLLQSLEGGGKIFGRPESKSKLHIDCGQGRLIVEGFSLIAPQIEADTQGFAVAFEGARGVAEICVVRVPLNVADPLVGSRQFALEIGRVRRVFGEAVEIFQSAVDQNLSRGRGTGQILNAVVNVKKQRVRELAHIVKALLGASLLGAGNPRLANDREAGGEDHQREDRRQRQGKFVAANELAAAVSEGTVTRRHR